VSEGRYMGACLDFCRDCGVKVADSNIHDRWHAKLDSERRIKKLEDRLDILADIIGSALKLGKGGKRK